MNIKTLLKSKVFPIESNRYSQHIFLNLLLNNAISRCSIGATTRNLNPAIPQTWEFSGFSQNGEDGIVDYLLSGLKDSNRYFIEIGSGNGLENNTSYLSHVKKFSGLQVEGDAGAHSDALVIEPWLTESVHCFVNESTAGNILQKAAHKDPDVFSLDIDGMDFHILKLLLNEGLRPKIIIAEYNSAFGRDRSITIPYDAQFNMLTAGHPYLYYGVSIKGWEKLLADYGYKLVTVESNGVNCFFIRTADFVDGFTDSAAKIHFKENVYQWRLFGKGCDGQFEIIRHLPFHDI